MSGPGGAPPAEGVDEGTLRDLRAGVHRRGTVEFDRFGGFSDGVFGFAMTLLISIVAVPQVAPAQLGEALELEFPDLLAFFISFAVVGLYWVSHHRFVAILAWVDGRLMRLNLVLLGLIAFLPFPTALIGRYEDEPVSVVLFAGAMSLASGVEALMLDQARRAGALRVPLSDAAHRHLLRASLTPVGIFLVSMPVAFVSASWAPLVWLLLIPTGRRSARGAPPDATVLG